MTTNMRNEYLVAYSEYIFHVFKNFYKVNNFLGIEYEYEYGISWGNYILHCFEQPKLIKFSAVRIRMMFMMRRRLIKITILAILAALAHTPVVKVWFHYKSRMIWWI